MKIDVKKLLKSLLIICIFALSSCGGYTRLTASQQQRLGKPTCPTYSNSMPIKKEVWKKYYTYRH